MADDKDIEVQLDGLFDFTSDLDLPAEETDLLIEEKIVAFLGGDTASSEAEPTAVEPAMVELPPLTPSFGPDQPREDADVEEPEAYAAAVSVWESRLQEQRARILNTMLNILAVIATVIVAFQLINVVRDPGQWLLVYVPYFVAYAILMAVTTIRRTSPTIQAYVLAALAYGVGIAALLNEGPLSAGGLYLLAAPLLLSILVRQRTGVIASVASSLIFASFLLADHLGWLHPSAPYRPDILPSTLSLISTFVLLISCVMFVQWVFNHTLTDTLREAEQKRGESVRAQTLLKERADELGRTNALLQKRTLQLQTTAQISSAATYSVVSPDKLMQQVVELICERFDLYNVGLFLTDAYGQWALLQAEAGEAGHRVMPEDRKVVIDASTAVGWCIVNAQARIASGIETTSFTDSLSGPVEEAQAARLLSAARSRMALPLRSRGRVIGALELQSSEPDALTEEDIPVLQTMADQIAAAVDNAQLFAEAQARLREVEEIQRLHVREQWAEFLSTYGTPTYERTQSDVTPLSDDILTPEVAQAMRQRTMVVKSGTGNETGQAAVIVPIRLRDEAVGILGLQDIEGGRQWTDGEIALIEAVADQLALAIENTRLLEETQQRAEQERIIADITSRVRASMDPETILQTAVRELGAALGTDRAFIQLGVGTSGDRTTTKLHKKPV
jgi:GAF domain-containing protein